MKSYGMTIQMTPLQQYFHMVLFVFQYFTKWNVGLFLNFEFTGRCILGSERVMQNNYIVINSNLPSGTSLPPLPHLILAGYSLPSSTFNPLKGQAHGSVHVHKSNYFFSDLLVIL